MDYVAAKVGQLSSARWIRRLAKEQLARRGFRLARVAEEPSFGDHLLRVFSHLGINCVLDVGAATGEYGTFLRGAGYQGHIVSFEPVKRSFDSLSKAAARDPLWHALPYALGDRTGEETINVFQGSTFYSLLGPSSYGKRAFEHKLGQVGEEVVRIRRLADVFEECIHGISDARIFLKMDTQGYDLAVVEGAGKVLDRVLGLQTELALLPIYEDMRTIIGEALPALQKRGFDVTGLFPVTRDKHDGLRIIELDCIMIRSS